MALFKPYKITSDKLEDLAIQEGQIIITTDTKKLYVDVSATERIEVTSDAEIDTSVFVTKEDADAAYAAISHNHDDRYYTESEVDSKLADKANATHTHTIANVTNLQETIDGLEADIAGKANVSHTHDDRYFTESEVTDKLATKADTGHKHAASDVTSGTFALDRIPTITDAKISGMSASKLTGTIPTANLPSYVDDVVEGATTANFPETGEAGKIYVATSTNKTYRWSGSSYVEISASLALGTTSSTAFRGDYGNVAYTHATAKGSAFASGLYKITTNAQGHVTAATAVTKNDITALGIPAQDTNTNTTYTISKSGSTITLTGSDGKKTSVTDSNTTYSLSSFGITATAAELNKLDGCTATVTELNYVDGVTSNIQTQLNGKAASSHTHSYLPLSGGTLTGRLTANGKISAPTSGSSWISGMTVTNATLGITTPNTHGAYCPIIACKTYGGHFWNLGTITDAVGFYGFKSGRTQNGTDWAFTIDVTTGNVTASHKITAPTFVGALSGNASTATTATQANYWTTARTLTFTGNVTGSVSVRGNANMSCALTLANDSVTSAKIAANAVTASEIASGAVGLSELSSAVGTVAVQSAAPTDSHVKLWIKV